MYQIVRHHPSKTCFVFNLAARLQARTCDRRWRLAGIASTPGRKLPFICAGKCVRSSAWEKREGLPVHRQFHTKAGTVCAFKQEIDAWLKNRRHPSNEAVLQVRHWNQSVDWSSPMTLVARCAGENCSLWLVVAPGSRRLESDSGIGTIDGSAVGAVWGCQ